MIKLSLKESFQVNGFLDSLGAKKLLLLSLAEITRLVNKAGFLNREVTEHNVKFVLKSSGKTFGTYTMFGGRKERKTQQRRIF